MRKIQQLASSHRDIYSKRSIIQHFYRILQLFQEVSSQLGIGYETYLLFDYFTSVSSELYF